MTKWGLAGSLAMTLAVGLSMTLVWAAPDPSPMVEACGGPPDTSVASVVPVTIDADYPLVPGSVVVPADGFEVWVEWRTDTEAVSCWFASVGDVWWLVTETGSQVVDEPGADPVPPDEAPSVTSTTTSTSTTSTSPAPEPASASPETTQPTPSQVAAPPPPVEVLADSVEGFVWRWPAVSGSVFPL